MVKRAGQAKRSRTLTDMINEPLEVKTGYYGPDVPEHMPLTQDELTRGLEVLSEPVLPEHMDPYSDYWRQRYPELRKELEQAVEKIGEAKERAINTEHGLNIVLAEQKTYAKLPGNITHSRDLAEATRDRLARMKKPYKTAVGQKGQAAGVYKKWDKRTELLMEEYRLYRTLIAKFG